MGRPRKILDEEVNDEPKEPLSAEPISVTPGLTVKVIAIGEYLEKARAVYGPDDIWNNAIALLYTENHWPQKNIQVIDKKGEQRFVVEL